MFRWWLWDCWGPSQRENNPIFGRLDAMVDFTAPEAVEANVAAAIERGLPCVIGTTGFDQGRVDGLARSAGVAASASASANPVAISAQDAMNSASPPRNTLRRPSTSPSSRRPWMSFRPR